MGGTLASPGKCNRKIFALQQCRLLPDSFGHLDTRSVLFLFCSDCVFWAWVCISGLSKSCTFCDTVGWFSEDQQQWWQWQQVEPMVVCMCEYCRRQWETDGWTLDTMARSFNHTSSHHEKSIKIVSVSSKNARSVYLLSVFSELLPSVLHCLHCFVTDGLVAGRASDL